MINLNKKVLNQIKRHTILEAPKECCGLIYEKNDKIYVYNCKNIAANTLVNFKISYFDYLKASKLGNITAYYHSHCNEECSDDFTELDKLNSYNHRLPLILYYLPKDQFKVYNGEQSKYLGVKFEWNKNDCINLVEKFYSEELKIDLNFSSEFRNDTWFQKHPTRIEDNFNKYGFSKIYNNFPGIKYLKYGDVITISYSKNEPISHVMIYLNNNQILHQRINSYSTAEIYNNTLKQLTSSILRHKNLC